jgi:hypothetical protein
MRNEDIVAYFKLLYNNIFEIRMKTKEISFSAASIPHLWPNQPPRALALRVNAPGR